MTRQQKAVPMKRLRRGQQPAFDPQEFARGAARREAQARKSRIRELEQKLSDLQQELILAVREIVPKCRDCGGEKILIKTSHHLVHPGNDIIGPAGRGPSFATHLDSLFCDDCGRVYYTSKVEQLGRILRQIEEVQGALLKAKSPRNCVPDVEELLGVIEERGQRQPS